MRCATGNSSAACPRRTSDNRRRAESSALRFDRELRSAILGLVMRTLRSMIGALSVCLVGCGGASWQDICDQVAECEGESSRTKCETNLGHFADVAEAEDCEGDFDDYIECIDEEGACNEGEDRCDERGRAFAECFNRHCDANPNDERCKLI